MNSNAARLFVVSFLVLFAEVMAIRWLAIEIPILRIFPNMILMIIFIGCSAGLCLHNTNKGPSPPVVIISALMLFIMVCFAGPLGLYRLSLNFDPKEVHPLISILVIAFVAVNLVTTFMAVGITLGKEFSKPSPLQAYSINILGSLAGVLAFAIISWLWLPGAAWLLICLLAVYYLVRKPYVLLIALLAVPVAYMTGSNATWSPYSRVEIVPIDYLDETLFGKENYTLNANHQFFHAGLKTLSPPEEEKLFTDQAKAGREVPLKGLFLRYHQWFRLPFLVMPKPQSLLVLGAGSGNDVSYALKKGVPSIDAVEIDPYIASVGKTRHPDHPYADSKVSVDVEDARTFLRYSDKKFDMIQFAYLDPGDTLALSSFLRLDNFVYTEESLRGALKHLNPGGMVFLSFATGARSPITQRLYETITLASDGVAPIAFVNDQYEHCFFFFGPGAEKWRLSRGEAGTDLDRSQIPMEKLGLRPWPGPNEYAAIEPATDDWPFLYLSFTAASAILYLIVLLATVVAPSVVLSRSVYQYKGPVWPLAAMFFLGMAFMLVETKSITQLSLLFGSTWIVSSAVITSILVLAWLANRLVMSIPNIKIEYIYIGLAIAVLVDYLWTIPDVSSMPPVVVAVVSSLIRCLPIFFGGMIFSKLLKDAPDSVYYLSANLLGVAFGGLLENLCIWTGIRNLSLAVLILYGLSFAGVALYKRASTSTPTPGETQLPASEA